MADTKISGLPASTTPLVGTEVLPVVQSGATKQVSVADLTAGRALSTGALSVTGTVTSTSRHIVNGSSAGISDISYGSYDNGAWVNGLAGYNSYLATGGSGVLRWSASGVAAVSGNFILDTAGKGVNFTANTPAAGMTSQLLNWYEEGTWTPTDQSGAGLTFASVDGYYTKIGRQVFAHFYITYPITVDASNNAIGGLPFTAANTNAARGGSVLNYSEFNSVSSIYGPKNNTLFSVTDGVGNSRTNAVMSGRTIMGCIVYFA